MNQPHHRPKRRFEVADAVVGVLERRLLVYGAVRRVVRCNEVDYALAQSFGHRPHVLTCAQGRSDLCVRVVGGLRE